MTYKWIYKTPPQFDDILMNSDGKFLTGLWFDESKDAAKHKIECEEKYLDIFGETCLWLDIYFGGKQPDFIPAYRLENFTEFRGEVADIMKEIPFGATLTYNDIAKRRRCGRKQSHMYHYSVSQSCWNEWKPYRLWRWN